MLPSSRVDILSVFLYLNYFVFVFNVLSDDVWSSCSTDFFFLLFKFFYFLFHLFDEKKFVCVWHPFFLFIFLVIFLFILCIVLFATTIIFVFIFYFFIFCFLWEWQVKSVASRCSKNKSFVEKKPASFRQSVFVRFSNITLPTKIFSTRRCMFL